MRIILFGTGRIFKRYKCYVEFKHVTEIIDNSNDKHNEECCGYQIKYPSEVAYKDCDYVIIMTDSYDVMKKQLLGSGVPSKKIKSYKDIGKIFRLDISMYIGNKQLNYAEWDTGEKKIFIMSHSGGRTGVPIALMNHALLLRELGWNVVYGILDSGSISEELKMKGIPCIDDIILKARSEKFLNFLRNFDMILIGTLVLTEFEKEINSLMIPTIWWIHESQKSLYEKYKLPENDNHIKYYGVGDRVFNMFLKFYPDKKIDSMIYYLPDTHGLKKNKSKIFTFTFIGSDSKRKGLDILVQAIKCLEENVRNQIQVIMVCPDAGNDDYNMVKEIQQIIMMGERNQQEILEIYSYTDILVCPSRDDPMPIVVTQAIQHEIPCIVSDNVGQSIYFEDNNGGFVFENENYRQLADIMKFCVLKNDLIEEGEKARQVYDCFFSPKYVINKMKTIFGFEDWDKC